MAQLPISGQNLQSAFAQLSNPRALEQFLEQLSPQEADQLIWDWPVWCRKNQYPPKGKWKTWLMLGGRGAGKTRTGSEWVRMLVFGGQRSHMSIGGRIALIGETVADVRDVMVEGESGLLSVHPKHQRPQWLSSQRKLIWPNGVIGNVFSAHDPDSLRGHQFGAAWCDEMCKWRYMQKAWDMLQFTLRLGDRPRQLITTTPKPSKLLAKLAKHATTVVYTTKTADNAHNLATGFYQHMVDSYQGTRLGRQELDGEILTERENSLWNRRQFEEIRIDETDLRLQKLQRVVIAVDPPATSTARSAACGIIAAANDVTGQLYVLEDATTHKAPPALWAKTIVELFHRHAADLVIAESNQGGEMVESVMHSIDPDLPVRRVYAARNKWSRAEPVSLLYEKGRVLHAGKFPELEDQMCNFGPDGLAEGYSPDRLDALVWALGELTNLGSIKPRIRSIS